VYPLPGKRVLPYHFSMKLDALTGKNRMIAANFWDQLNVVSE
jgi:hypothetical protein